MPSILNLPRDAWSLAKPYFNSEERWSARGKLAAVIAMNLTIVGMDVLLNFWNGAFFNSLQNKDSKAFIELLFSYYRTAEPNVLWGFFEIPVLPGFVEIAFFYILLSIYQTYMRQWLEISWRKWMTAHTIADWLSDRAYYRISLATSSGTGEGTDNPDQRIAEDIRDYVSQSLLLPIDLLSNIVTLFSFVTILWTLSGAVEVLGVHIPGYMVWIALAYAAIGTALTHLVGKPLIALNFRKQKVEADFRFSLVRLRENLEGVALYRGEAQERDGLAGQFLAIRDNWWAIMKRVKALNALIAGYSQLSGIFPIVVAAPRFFAGTLELGGLTRTAGAFSSVQGAMSWFVNSYASLAAWRATIDRLIFFRRAIDAARAADALGVQAAPGGGDYVLENPKLLLPDGRVLFADGAVTLQRGRSAVFTGRSGSGKSTLFRAFAGIWPFGTGTVRTGAGSSLFLPQRPYLPLGTLREALCYPGRAEAVSEDVVLRAIDDVGLGALAPMLDQREQWSQRLSGGEQQRVALARALIMRPDWLFLDEATASLDPESEREVFARLRERLPGTTIISIAHHPDLASQHDARLVVMREGDAPGHIVTEATSTGSPT